MAGRGVIFVTMLVAGLVIADAARAQLSPRGIIGGITRPFGEMLGRFGHFPRRHRTAATGKGSHRTAATDRAPRDTAPRESSAASGLAPAGPPVWPDAFEDVVGFVVSPDDYAQKLRGRGFSIIADTIIGPTSAQPRAHVATTTGTAVRDDAETGASAESCNTPVNRNNWPAARIEQLMQLRDAQHDTLDRLQAAINQSAKAIGGGCPEAGTSLAPDRLQALIQTLWTVRDGGISIRAPLKNFIDTLTDAQKSTLAGRQPLGTQVASAGSANDSGKTKLYQACAAPNVEASERMIKEVANRVRPNKEQAASLANFRKASSDMAKLLVASCTQAVPADPLARLDAAEDQLTAMNYAVTAVQIAFYDFYGKLDTAQKVRLESTSR